MQYRCRVGTATGEVIEATYVADSETRLRADLEEKGLHLLKADPLDALAALRIPGLSSRGRAGRRRVGTNEFLVFNQELATLLKAGMPLVQSLEILRRNVPNPVFKGVLDDVYEKVRSGTALSDAFEAHAAELEPGGGMSDQLPDRMRRGKRPCGSARRVDVPEELEEGRAVPGRAVHGAGELIGDAVHFVSGHRNLLCNHQERLNWLDDGPGPSNLSSAKYRLY